MANLTQRWRFLRGFFRNPGVVGSLVPSSEALAKSLCEPFRRSNKPARLLEVGAGTGAITRHIGELLGDKDELDICEIVTDFADILETTVLTEKHFAGAVAGGRVRLLRSAVQEIQRENYYDFVISGLPLTAFGFRDVRDVFAVIRRCLKPEGVFSYFEYVGLRRTSRLLTVGRGRKRIRLVSAYLDRRIRDHQFARRTVLKSLPPAYARHLRFNNGSANGRHRD